MTYWAINAVFLTATALVAGAATLLVRSGRRAGIRLAPLLTVLVVVLALTAVFDNVMIGVGLVGYDAKTISGVFVGMAPLEDFAYAVAAVILLPSMWVIAGPRLASAPEAASHRADPPVGSGE